MTKINKKYNNEFKSETIKLALSSGSISGTAKSLGSNNLISIKKFKIFS